MATAPPTIEQRLRSVRRTRDGALLGGVCAGLARALGVDVLLVRLVVVAATVAVGVGLPLYLAAWALLPRDDGRAAFAVPRRASASAAAGVGVGLLVLGALGGMRELGVWWSDAVVWPVVLTAGGLALIWRQSRPRSAAALEDRGASRVPGAPPVPTSGPLGELPRFGPRLIVGALLVAAGGVLLLQSIGGVGTLGQLAVATMVVVTGVTLIFGTSWFGLLQALREERLARIRSQERAELSAHLHDSVLQTLALIQRRGDAEISLLARRQERELRSWLAGEAPDGAPVTLARALEAMAGEVELDHHVTVEVVAVGDAPLDEPLRALVAAAREAVVNAAKFAGTGHVDVFAEATADRVEVFVRDRGPGFDPAAVPAERRGVRESIVGRMERHGGAATVRSGAGDGTEVELVVTR
jgi:phage shock protein PspC (stress-responsive transcriptional regulator)